MKMEKTKFKTTLVDGIKIAYREAGDPHKPTLLLLHGYPPLLISIEKFLIDWPIPIT